MQTSMTQNPTIHNFSTQLSYEMTWKLSDVQYTSLEKDERNMGKKAGFYKNFNGRVLGLKLHLYLLVESSHMLFGCL